MRPYKLLFFIVLLLPAIAFSQKQARQLLHGRVVADSLVVDNLSVNNITSRIGAVTDSDGLFTLYARPTDTLFFSSVTFHSVHLILKESDFRENPLVIKLDVNVTVLDEVIVRPSVLTGTLDKDSKRVKTKTITSSIESARELNRYVINPLKYGIRVNGTLPPDMSQMNGINFTRIYDMYFRKRKKKQDRGEIYSAETAKPFPEAVKELYTYYFFTQTLSIPKDDIGLFLIFCDKGEETKPLLDPKKEFELTDYLIQKSKEFLASKK